MLVYQRVCFSHFFVHLSLSLSLSCVSLCLLFIHLGISECVIFGLVEGPPKCWWNEALRIFSILYNCCSWFLDRDVDSLYLLFGENVFVSSIPPRLNYYSPETNSSHLKTWHLSKERFPTIKIYKCEILVSGRVLVEGLYMLLWPKRKTTKDGQQCCYTPVN